MRRVRGFAGGGEAQQQDAVALELAGGGACGDELAACVQAEHPPHLRIPHRHAQEALLRLAEVVGAEDVGNADLGEDQCLAVLLLPLGDEDEVHLRPGGMAGIEEGLIPHVGDADAVFTVCGDIHGAVRREVAVAAHRPGDADKWRVLDVAMDFLERMRKLADDALLVGVEVRLHDFGAAEDDGEVFAAVADATGVVDVAEVCADAVGLGHASELFAVGTGDIVLVTQLLDGASYFFVVMTHGLFLWCESMIVVIGGAAWDRVNPQGRMSDRRRLRGHRYGGLETTQFHTLSITPFMGGKFFLCPWLP